jgi:predicted dehydrogenase
MPYRAHRRRITRRSFVGGSVVAATVAALPRGGVFAAGSDTIRFGVVGCGGRGTGAALQAAAADRGVVISAIGGLFSDEVAASAERLTAALGHRFDCPAGRRFAGFDAGSAVIHADIDAVILATPPHLRPGHVAAAVAAGRHIYCETPAAVDSAGVSGILASSAEAASRGLSIVSGLRWRRDRATASTIARIHAGDLGRVLGATAIAQAAPPSQRSPHPGWSTHETRLRNWISEEQFSGGAYVEHHVHAIDRALWSLGDERPVMAVALQTTAPLPAPAATPRSPTVRLLFSDGRWIDVGIDRRSGVETGCSATVRGTSGTADLVEHTIAGRTVGVPIRPEDPLANAAAALVGSLRGGERIDDLSILCRSTATATLVRTAARTPHPVRWIDLGIPEPILQPSRPVQWDVG